MASEPSQDFSFYWWKCKTPISLVSWDAIDPMKNNSKINEGISKIM
jgi:hypothetical protein